MESIYIIGQSDNYFVPGVNFDAETGICELSGESYLEETYSFYKPLFLWLENYTATVQKPVTFNIKLTYFNTSSSKCILDILRILKKYQRSGGEVIVNWYLKKGDEDMEEEIEDYTMVTGLKINPVTTNE